MQLRQWLDEYVNYDRSCRFLRVSDVNLLVHFKLQEKEAGAGSCRAAGAAGADAAGADAAAARGCPCDAGASCTYEIVGEAQHNI